MGCICQKEEQILYKSNIDDINWLIPKGRVKAKVLEVYDGDTITVSFFFPTDRITCANIYKDKIRFVGINAPEITLRNGTTKEEKKRGLEVKEILTKMLDQKIVEIECYKREKYGRLLGTVYLNGKNINEFLVVQGYAVRKNYD